MISRGRLSPLLSRSWGSLSPQSDAVRGLQASLRAPPSEAGTRRALLPERHHVLGVPRGQAAGLRGDGALPLVQRDL
eukprot:3006358-Alexandrium_andersonii.AAC.1